MLKNPAVYSTTNIQETISAVWLAENMSINPKSVKKYQTMNIRNKSVNYGDKTSITVNGKDIMESDNLEPLGVTNVLIVVLILICTLAMFVKKLVRE